MVLISALLELVNIWDTNESIAHAQFMAAISKRVIRKIGLFLF
jgi:hypothetical protein